MNALQFNQLLEESGSSLYGFCCYLTGSQQEAEDLYQETWLKAWERCRRIKPDSNPRSFLLSITMGLWKNRCRKQARRQKLAPRQNFSDWKQEDFPDIAAPLPEDMILKQEQLTLLRQLVLSMEEKWRVVLYLYYGLELPVKEIATLQKIPAGTVKSRLNKARALLRQGMEEYGYDME